MKRIGMLGGMSWESSMEYYRIMNEHVKLLLGGSHSAKCIMSSFDFHEIESLQHKGEWDQLTDLMVEESNRLKLAGAECLVICTNTMHLMAPTIELKTGMKIIHIADATADEIISRKVDKVLLLGTKFTMEGTFYKDRLIKRGIEVVVPDEIDRSTVHEIIYKELILGIIKQDSKKKYIDIIEKAMKNGATGVVLGCTEIPLLIKSSDVSVEVFDTTHIHSIAAINYALEEGD